MHQALTPVTVFDAGLKALAADMTATMYAADGVGLAACQIGENVSMFVFDCPDDTGERWVGVVCNPVLTLPEGGRRNVDSDDEGCLSFPGAFVTRTRPDWARVDGAGLDGEPVTFEGFGLLARCLQHETDHLFGKVFADGISDRARKKLNKAHTKAAHEFPADWPVSPRLD